MAILVPFAHAQNYQVEFGKNRIQHHKFTWFEYETNNFRTYWSGDARSIAHTTVQMAEWDYIEIQELLEHRINRKIELIVYTDITDVKQSNIGSEEVFSNTGGYTKIVENKVFVYFDGNHSNLRKQIREGIAQVYINNMLFGTNLQEVVQNAVLLNLPKWYTQGLAGYVGEKWNTDLDNQLRDVFLSNKYKDFEEFAAAQPKLAGQSLWYYIDVNYGQSTASNLIYLTRINRSVGSGFLYVLGSPYGRTLINWKDYFEKRYNKGIKSLNLPSDSLQIKVKNKHNLPIANARVSPDGKHIVYSTNEQGKQKIYIQNLTDGKRKLIFKTGFRNNIQVTDYGYPLIDWTPNSQMVGIVYEKRDVVKFVQIDINTKKKVSQDFAPLYQRVYSINYINNNDLLISGAIRGISDIFIYHINQRSTDRITNDFYDDLEPAVVRLNGKDGIMFKSNRGDDLSMAQNGLDSIIPFGTFDIYFHEIAGSKELVRVTDTPLASESSPMHVDSSYYAYLSDVSGIRNRYAGELEEYIAYYEKVVQLKDGEELLFYPDSIPNIPDTEIDTIFIRPIVKMRGKNIPSTNYARNIIDARISNTSGKLVENIFHDGTHKLYLSNAIPNQQSSIYNSVYRQQLLKMRADEEILKQDKQKEQKKNQEPKEKPSSWEFEPDVGMTDEIDPVENDTKIPRKPTEEDEVGFVFITDYFEDETEKDTPIETDTPKKEEKEDEIIDIDNYEFENDFNTEVTDAAVIVESDDGRITLESPKITYAKEVYEKPDKRVHRFYTPKILSHKLRFKANTVAVQLDNSQLFGGYDIYTGTPYQQTPPSIFFKSSVQDLFEDYILEGGLRIPINFNGLEYYVTFKDRKKRLDKSYTYYRKSLKQTIDAQEEIPLLFPNVVSPFPSPFINPYHSRSVSNLLQGEFKYPLDIYSSFNGIARFRTDKIELLANDPITLESSAVSNQTVSLGLEYVFDNTLDIDLNIKHGTRLKVYAEVYKKMEVSLFDDARFDLQKGAMVLLGADVRHYQRLGKYAVLATRFTGATSLGSDKILYYLGGGDSEILPGFNNNIPLPDVGAESGFAYQTQATSLRGFKTNIRNGNSFFLGNVEMRVPVFKYFYKKPIKSSIIRNFQLVGFFDVGTAWRGSSPFSNDNPLNTTIIAPPAGAPQTIVVQVNYFRDPIVAGFGGGVRTKLFGYFIRLDYGVGIETKQLQKGTWHLSLGTDF
ncbi:MAG: hypothetical protein ACI94Y_001669 [Maribacter sp.]|jgi:hypothetical protein